MNKNCNTVKRCFAAFCVAAVLITGMAAGICGCGSGKENGKLTEIQEEIGRFREGGEFGGDAGRYMTEGRPDAVVLEELSRGLTREEEHVREQICHLLADLGKRVDPLYSKGGELIRDRSVVAMLAGDVLSRQTPARDICLEYLLRNVPAVLLKGFGKQLADNLRLFPDQVLLLVIAKAKLTEAAETVDLLMENPGWAKEAETRVAAAALGNREIEKEFTDRFMAETDPKEKSRLAKLLGYIGTQTALTAVAGEMRTDLVIENPNVSVRSLRIFLVEALRYNYPDKLFLFDNAVSSDADYEVIEKFCEDTFGVRWKSERPPFLWIEGFPSAGPGE
ncbi:MAG: hypothetical protein KAV42_09320 [Candidatus Krumholzibacteria bacterium]|nr:hypothetical protein [Candidatus Krumholzibacteria bacterium]